MFSDKREKTLLMINRVTPDLMWWQITRSYVTRSSFCLKGFQIILNGTQAHSDQLLSEGAQRTAAHKVCRSLAFWQVFACCMWEFVMCVWLVLSHCRPPGCTARAMQKGSCVSVCFRERVKRVCVCMTVCTLCMPIDIHTIVGVCVCVCFA